MYIAGSKSVVSSVSSECMKSSYSIGPAPSSPVYEAGVAIAAYSPTTDSIPIRGAAIAESATTATTRDLSASMPTLLLSSSILSLSVVGAASPSTSAPPSSVVVTVVSTPSISYGETSAADMVSTSGNEMASTGQNSMVMTSHIHATSTASGATSASPSHTSAHTTTSTNQANGLHGRGILTITMGLSFLLMRMLS